MNWHKSKVVHVPGKLGLVTASLGLAFLLIGRAGAQTTFGGNAQHTANYSPAAQNLNAVHWTTSIDLNNTGGYAHYGAPLITPSNTIFVPVKTGATGGFKINAFNAANGASIYSLSTDYAQPSHNWILAYQPVLATSSETRLYYPGAGGTIYYVNNVDSAGHGAPVQQVFYTTLANYQANAAAFNSTVFINTPITADSSGNVFFGFRVNGTAPAPLSTTQSGFARIDPSGNAIYVLAGTAASDANIGRDTHNSAPALSNDQTTLYMAVKGPSTETYGYLLGLNSSTLATKYKVFLKDPRSNNANNATLLDDSTASPMVGPDNDVYFGIYGNPANGSRGFMLHFSSDLTVEKTPGGFGWDNTAAVVPASMVPSYTGTSTYLLLSKYNNYANAGGDSADGVNRVALLDPNATQVDAHASSNGMLIMREVLTVIGPTADKENRSASLPYAVREWCIDTAAVNPATNSVFFPSEDGHIYRWNLVSNSLTQFLQLNIGIGLPYVPTIIGPDGQVFTLNGGTLSAMGSLSGVGIALTSSTPDVRNVVTGQSLTFSVAVTNTGTSGITPTGTVTITDTVYFVPSPGVLNSTTVTLASNLPLDANGNAAVTTTALTADKHFITVSYSGDANFSAGNSSLIQFVHASGTTTALASSPNPSNVGQQVTFTATVASVPPGSGTPTGMVTFQDGNTVLGQVPLNGSAVASFSTSGLALGSHTVTAVYASDTNFAASSGSRVQTVQNVYTTATTASSSPNPSVFGQSVTFTSTTTSSGGVPVGTVTFKEGATVWASNVTVDGSGHASFSTTALAVGSHTITANFTGAAGWANSSGNAAPQVVNKASTTTAVSSSSNPAVYSQPVTFTSTVTATAPGSGVPTGTVTFKNGSTTLGTGTLDGSGHATFTTSTLTVASHSITAVYNGSASFNTSTSPILTQTVNKDSTTSTVTSSLNPSLHRQPVTFTATVVANAPGTAIPTGTVTFKDGTNTLHSGSLNTSGQASFTTSSLSRGTHHITAVYEGNSSFLTSTSTVLVQTVN
jgi:Bacterial Ig-like domain (group 3)